MTTRVAWLSALIGLAVASPLSAQTETEAQLERAAERRFRSAEQFYAGGRYGQALRDLEAILDTMPGSRLADDAALRVARHRFEVEGGPGGRGGDGGPSLPWVSGGRLDPRSPPASRTDCDHERPAASRRRAGRVRAGLDRGGTCGLSLVLRGAHRDRRDRVRFHGRPDGGRSSALRAPRDPRRSGLRSPAVPRPPCCLPAPSRGSGESDAAFGEVAELRADLLRVIRDDPSDEANGDFSARRLAEEASELATLVSRYRSPGGPSWRFTGAIRPPQRLDRPRRVRIAGGQLHVSRPGYRRIADVFARRGVRKGNRSRGRLGSGLRGDGGWRTAVRRFRWWRQRKPWWWAEIS